MVAAPAPSPIVALLQQSGEQLESWAVAHRRATLAEHEQGVLAIFRQVMGAALAAVLTRALELDQPARRRLREPCPGCGARRVPHSWRPRQVLSTCGAVRLERPYFYCGPCRRGWCPADATLELGPSQALSRGMIDWLALAGGLEAFRPAAALVEELTGIGVGSETVRTHTEAVGKELDLARRQAAEQVERTREPAGPLDPADGLLVVMADGLQLRYLDDWHEVKLGLVSGCRPGWPAPGTQPGQAHELVGPSYLASEAKAPQFGPLLLAEAARRGALEVVGWEHLPDQPAADVRAPALAVLREVVVLGDGAPWIWTLAAEHFGQARTEIVDWYHASQHVWSLGKALHGDGTPETAAWVTAALDRLWEHGATGLLARLAETVAPTPQAAEALRLEQGYFSTNEQRMDYPAFRQRGLPIGSGAVESAAKHLVQQRMKRAGMRWSHPGGEALLALSGHLTNTRPRPRAA